MNIFKAIGKHSKDTIDSFALFLRRQGYIAYVETGRQDSFLITNYNLSSLGYEYVGETL